MNMPANMRASSVANAIDSQAGMLNPGSRALRNAALRSLLDTRILVLDGAFGTTIQNLKLDEAAYRGARFADHPCPQKGNNDLLILSDPDIIRAIHRDSIEAGAELHDGRGGLRA
jgi:5-methyltetrahydrofolate--homocysteine methyltransferase